ncbi:efflux RND transporter periplasmic adaptor subunit [Candidatus Binatia bacterium]|nr:efflux RND transporter periplasmic adaptor subunit [Candidatus Binatia bacterium]
MRLNQCPARASTGLATLLAVLALAGVPACSRDSYGDEAKQASGVAADESRPLRVAVERPVAVAGGKEMVLPGTVEAWESVPLYARVTGYLEEVDVDIGDEVAAGERVARLAVPEVTAGIKGAEARVIQEKAELDLARLTLSRLQALRRANSAAIPQQDVDTAAARVRVEDAQVRLAEADRDRLDALRELARIVAPFPGRITRRVLHPGALVREGNSAGAEPIVEIARIDRLRLAFEIPELLAPYVKEGAPAIVRFDAFPGSDVSLPVARVAGALDPATRSMRAEMHLDDGAGRYRPGMFASVKLAVETGGGAVSVPSRAVRGHGNERFVLVADNGVLRRRPVVVGSDDGRRASIARGLGPDDRVMVAGSPLARDGVACEAVEG